MISAEPVLPVAAGVIRAATAAELPGLKAVIDAADLFPSAMLDEMIAPYPATTPG